MSDADYERVKAENPQAQISKNGAAHYFGISRALHPQDSVLSSTGIWTEFDVAEERAQVRATRDGEFKHAR